LSRKRRNKYGSIQYEIVADIRLAAVDDNTGCCFVLPDYDGSTYTTDQTADTMALLSLVAIVDTPNNTVASREQNKRFQPGSAVYPAGRDIRVIL
jgi:hypothetical protein